MADLIQAPICRFMLPTASLTVKYPLGLIASMSRLEHASSMIELEHVKYNSGCFFSWKKKKPA